MKTCIATFLIILLGTVAALRQHKVIASLREQNRSFLAGSKEIADLRNQNLLLRAGAVDTSELNALRGERIDLMKLRARVSELRRGAGKSPQEIADALQKTHAQIEAEQKKGDLLESTEKNRLISEKTMASIGGLNSIIFQLAKTNGEFPSSIEQATQWSQSTRFGQYFNWMMTNSSPDTVALTAFEFLPRGQPLKFAGTSPTLYLRERQPRAQPDGGWKRAYAYSDKQIVEIALPDANFESWESEHLTNKP